VYGCRHANYRPEESTQSIFSHSLLSREAWQKRKNEHKLQGLMFKYP
jgi:hypothetical protein